jgi:hypothetical protein
VYEEYNEQMNHYSWRDLLIVAFYRALFPLALDSRQHSILFCQAGTYYFENIFVHSPCKLLDTVNAELPLELFDMKMCKELFDHFWRFNITEEEKEDLLGQLLGPPKLMEKFFLQLAAIEKSPSNVSHADLQIAVDNAILSLEKTISSRLINVANAYDDYVRIVLYPQEYGGEIDDKQYIEYKPNTEGFKILKEKGSVFADSSILRLHRNKGSYIVEMPSRATQVVMSHILFDSRKEVGGV